MSLAEYKQRTLHGGQTALLKELRLAGVRIERDDRLANRWEFPTNDLYNLLRYVLEKHDSGHRQGFVDGFGAALLRGKENTP